jgi:hypothetical protein
MSSESSNSNGGKSTQAKTKQRQIASITDVKTTFHNDIKDQGQDQDQDPSQEKKRRKRVVRFKNHHESGDSNSNDATGPQSLVTLRSPSAVSNKNTSGVMSSSLMSTSIRTGSPKKSVPAGHPENAINFNLLTVAELNDRINELFKTTSIDPDVLTAIKNHPSFETSEELATLRPTVNILLKQQMDIAAKDTELAESGREIAVLKLHTKIRFAKSRQDIVTAFANCNFDRDDVPALENPKADPQSAEFCANGETKETRDGDIKLSGLQKAMIDGTVSEVTISYVRLDEDRVMKHVRKNLCSHLGDQQFEDILKDEVKVIKFIRSGLHAYKQIEGMSANISEDHFALPLFKYHCNGIFEAFQLDFEVIDARKICLETEIDISTANERIAVKSLYGHTDVSFGRTSGRQLPTGRIRKAIDEAGKMIYKRHLRKRKSRELNDDIDAESTTASRSNLSSRSSRSSKSAPSSDRSTVDIPAIAMNAYDLVTQETTGEIKHPYGALGTFTATNSRGQHLGAAIAIGNMRLHFPKPEGVSDLSYQVSRSFLSDFLQIAGMWRMEREGEDGSARYFTTNRSLNDRAFILCLLLLITPVTKDYIELIKSMVIMADDGSISGSSELNSNSSKSSATKKKKLRQQKGKGNRNLHQAVQRASASNSASAAGVASAPAASSSSSTHTRNRNTSLQIGTNANTRRALGELSNSDLNIRSTNAIVGGRGDRCAPTPEPKFVPLSSEHAAELLECFRADSNSRDLDAKMLFLSHVSRNSSCTVAAAEAETAAHQSV